MALWSMGDGGAIAGGSAAGLAWHAVKTIGLSLAMYVPYILKGFFPWSFFLPAGLWVGWKGIRKGGDGRLGFAFVWFAAGVLAFCLSGTRASRYMIPVFPAAALLVAFLWREAFERGSETAERAHRRLKAALWPLLVTGAAAAGIIVTAPVVLRNTRQGGRSFAAQYDGPFHDEIVGGVFRGASGAFRRGGRGICSGCAGVIVGGAQKTDAVFVRISGGGRYRGAWGF